MCEKGTQESDRQGTQLIWSGMSKQTCVRATDEADVTPSKWQVLGEGKGQDRVMLMLPNQGERGTERLVPHTRSIWRHHGRKGEGSCAWVKLGPFLECGRQHAQLKDRPWLWSHEYLLGVILSVCSHVSQLVLFLIWIEGVLWEVMNQWVTKLLVF